MLENSNGEAAGTTAGGGWTSSGSALKENDARLVGITVDMVDIIRSRTGRRSYEDSGSNGICCGNGSISSFLFRGVTRNQRRRVLLKSYRQRAKKDFVGCYHLGGPYIVDQLAL